MDNIQDIDVTVMQAREAIKDHMNKMPESNKALFKMVNKPAGVKTNEEAVQMSIDEVVDSLSDERLISMFQTLTFAKVLLSQEDSQC